MSGADAPITTYMTHHFSRCLKKMWKIEKDTFKVTKQALQIAWQFFPPKFVSQGRSVLRLYKVHGLCVTFANVQPFIRFAR